MDRPSETFAPHHHKTPEKEHKMSDEEPLGQTLWYPPKSVDPSRQPKINRFH
jgi:hypothetical protein